MTVSVVIPAFDAEAYLGEAIESVLAQTIAPCEVLVIDDGSADGTADIARSYGDPVTCVRQARTGPAGARNRGAELARGDELAFLDADDVWLPDKLLLQRKALSQDRQLDVVFGYAQLFHSPELTGPQRAGLALPGGAIRGICSGAMRIRRESYARVGEFATGWAVGEFLDWYARAVDARLRSVVLPETIMLRRLHLTNSGGLGRESQSDYARVLRTVLARRRGEPR